MPPTAADSTPHEHGAASDVVRRRVRVDAHVHIHPGFALDRFFASALGNLARAGGPGSFEAVLLLTESFGDDAFGILADTADRGEEFTTARGWRAHRSAHEPVTVRLEGPDGARLHVVAGRQIVTAEGLEVLALGCARRFDDGLGIASVLDALAPGDALAVIPWGFGKWMGARGKVLRRLIERARPGLFELGDNRARPGFFVEPPHFRQGRGHGMRILAGSDPLPMRAGVSQVGAYGFECEIEFDPERPWRSLRTALQSDATEVRTIGRRESALPFVRDQVAMQFIKRRRGKAPAASSDSSAAHDARRPHAADASHRPGRNA